MLTAFAAAALILSPATPHLEGVNLTRTFKAGESLIYSLKAEMSAGGMTQSVETVMVFKVRKATEDGAEVSMSVRSFKMSRDGAAADNSGPEESITAFDKFGMPHSMATQNEAWIYILASMSGFVPGKEIEVGNGFDVKWESKDKFFSATGKGKLKETLDHEGAKAAKLEYDLSVKPGDDTPGNVKYIALIGLEGSRPISAEGTVDVDGGQIKFSVKRLKE